MHLSQNSIHGVGGMYPFLVMKQFMSPSGLCVYIEVLKSKHKFVTKPFTLLRRRNKGSYYVCMHVC